MKLELCNKAGKVIEQIIDEKLIHLCVRRAYEEGDEIRISAPIGSFVQCKLDEAVSEAVLYAQKNQFVYRIPFGNEREPYACGAFEGEYHIYQIKLVDTAQEDLTHRQRDLSTNPLDIRGETGFYPHCTASVETRGESIFAARNTIDGYEETSSHGIWPYTSWGDNEDPTASITIDFGRIVCINQVEIHLRSDFPHDNYWKEVTLQLDHGFQQTVKLNKTGEGQFIELNGAKSRTITMCNLKKCENLTSPFPALTAWKVWGCETD